MNWGAPQPPKPKREKKEEDPLVAFKKAKPKCRISKAAARRIAQHDTATAFWVEDWIDNLVRGNAYPPQLVSDDFIHLLSTYFAATKALSILQSLRNDFRRVNTLPDDLKWLVDAIRADPPDFLPPHYLEEV